ncbi:hypothetical protein E2C01_034951 [Portunus trituberculatus]|uniref:Uncharacterized protein n=1 Tax=Portunus trituberculatus TaxID=210409 RepID=A0A5B7F2W5_PORTR|nr:hypothetical protein [Portunus trituberculatus]
MQRTYFPSGCSQPIPPVGNLKSIGSAVKLPPISGRGNYIHSGTHIRAHITTQVHLWFNHLEPGYHGDMYFLIPPILSNLDLVLLVLSDHADPSGAKAPEGHAYPCDGCRGKPVRSLCSERDGRIPLPYFQLWGCRCGCNHSWGKPLEGSRCGLL